MSSKKAKKGTDPKSNDKKVDSKKKPSKGSAKNPGKGPSKGKGRSAKSPAPPVKKQKLKMIEVDCPDFDLKAFAARYTGFTLITRLIYIAERCPSQQVLAYRMAIEALKKGCNTQVYLETVSMARQAVGDALGDEWGLDQAWVETTKRAGHERTNRINAALVEAKRIGEREPIRLEYMRLGNHQMELGEFSTALTTFLETKAAYTTNLHVVEGCLAVIKASIYLGSMSYVKSQCAIAQLPQAKADPKWIGRLNAASGLQSLKGGNFMQAASQFIAVGTSLGDTYNDVISTRDIAIYASVASLVTWNRKDLKELLKRTEFKNLLELVPIWRKIITDFSKSKYAACFEALQSQKNELLLDCYLGHHIPRLFHTLLEKALIQYFRPFTSVKIPGMAAAFNMDVPEMESHLVNLIADGKIQARIDSANKILYSRHADQRHATFQQALLTGQIYARDVRALLLRMSLGQHDFLIKHPKAGKGRRERHAADDDLTMMPSDYAMSGF